MTLKPNKHNYSAEELSALLFNKGVELLAKREHSFDELLKKITAYYQKKMAEFAIDDDASAQILSVVLKLQDMGYQSDQRFTEAYCRSRLSKGLGRARILLELNQRAIPKVMADATLEELAEGELAFEDIIYRTWRKKFNAVAQNTKEQAKQYRFLQYRGFGSNEISQLLTRLRDEDDSGV